MQIQYSGKDLSEYIDIKKDKSHNYYNISISLNEPWMLYAGDSVADINTDKAIQSADRPLQFKLNIKNNRRQYFFLKCASGQGIFSETHINLEGGYNMRDQGGIRNKEGKYLQWGKIFRSDDLFNLTTSDLQFIDNLNIQTIVDFRSTEEIEQAPDLLPNLAKSTVLSLKFGDLSAASIDDIVKLNKDEVEDFMYSIYRFLSSDVAIEQYKTFFNLVQESTDIPLLYHCSAGKDRTGMATALFLAALDVSEEAIYKDYLISNFYLANKYQKPLSVYPHLESMFIVKEDFLRAGFHEIEKKYQSLPNYLSNILKVDTNHLKEMYLF